MTDTHGLWAYNAAGSGERTAWLHARPGQVPGTEPMEITVVASDKRGINTSYQQQEKTYRDKALKLFPWICGRCAREFAYSNLRELTVHHKDHNHDNNPEDGSNWELLCLYCHDNEHTKFHEHILYGSTKEKEHAPATHNPFAQLKDLMEKK